MSLFDISEKKIMSVGAACRLCVDEACSDGLVFKQFTPLQPYDKRVQKAALIIREEHNSLPEYAVFASACNPSNVDLFGHRADSTNGSQSSKHMSSPTSQNT